MAKKLCLEATTERTLEKFEDSSDVLYVLLLTNNFSLFLI